MIAHTMGPWAANPVDARVDAFATGVPLPVCALLWPTAERSEAETEANARLIAAAPELLDVAVRARRLLLEICEEASFPIPQTWVDAADAAIAKATGTDEPIPGSDDLEELE